MSDPRTAIAFKRLIWAVPLVYVLHVAEEAAGGFAGWFSGVVGGQMDPASFAVSTLAFTAVIVGVTAWVSLTEASLVLLFLFVWAGAHLFWDPFFHLGVTLMQHRYSPGLITACLLCFPLALFVAAAALKQKVVGLRTLLACNLIGGALLAAVLIFGRHIPQLEPPI